MSSKNHITIKDRIEDAGGRPSGFDYMRIFLASSVIFVHSADLLNNHNLLSDALSGALRAPKAMILPMFFALSGFLVAGSLERSKTLISFLGLRVIRLMPALLVETLLCAFLIGPIFSSVSTSEYFQSFQFYSYLLNIFGDIHYYLPGLFLDNPINGIVNGQLSTIPWELRCYASIACLAAMTLVRRRHLLVCAVLGFNLFLILHEVKSGFYDQYYLISGSGLVQSFLYGVVIYLFRDKIIWNRNLFVFCLVCSLALLSQPFREIKDCLAIFPVAYVTVYLGLLQPPRNAILMSGDYSYGIYLYGFPIQQAAIEFLGNHGNYWYVNFMVSYPLAFLLAVGSWHCVEKYGLQLRVFVFRFEKWALRGIQTVESRLPAINRRT